VFDGHLLLCDGRLVVGDVVGESRPLTSSSAPRQCDGGAERGALQRRDALDDESQWYGRCEHEGLRHHEEGHRPGGPQDTAGRLTPPCRRSAQPLPHLQLHRAGGDPPGLIADLRAASTGADHAVSGLLATAYQTTSAWPVIGVQAPLAHGTGRPKHGKRHDEPGLGCTGRPGCGSCQTDHGARSFHTQRPGCRQHVRRADTSTERNPCCCPLDSHGITSRLMCSSGTSFHALTGHPIAWLSAGRAPSLSEVAG